MQRLPSLFKPYTVHVSCDDAFKQAPPRPPIDADDDTKAKWAEELIAHQTTVAACHDTGDWSPLLIEGRTPMKFVLKSADVRSLADRAELPESNPRRIGSATEQALLVRMALVDIPGVDFKIERKPDPKWDDWTLCQPEVIEALDALDRRIIAELHAVIVRRSLARPKS
jgi:hypothetical protein